MLPTLNVQGHNPHRLRLEGKTIAFTSPSLYSSRLQHLLLQEGASILPCPSISVDSNPQTREAVHNCICRSPSTSSPLPPFSGIAFTSRSGIRAVAEVLQQNPHLPWLFGDGDENPNASHLFGNGFFVAALGRDAELLKELDMFGENRDRVRVMVPSIATPQAMVEELGDGHGRHILCPVPVVEDLEEPPVVPDFLEALAVRGWHPYRLNAYCTKWAGAECAKPLLPLEKLDALIFTSTAEVEGLFKSLKELGTAMPKDRRRPIIAAHGPVTAAGAARLGIQVDVISKDFNSFSGIIDALDGFWGSFQR